jgi:hypothetical protein
MLFISLIRKQQEFELWLERINMQLVGELKGSHDFQRFQEFSEQFSSPD